MPSPSFANRLRRMSWSNRRLLVEGAATLVFASLAIRFLPFRQVVAKLTRPRRALWPAGDGREAEVRRVRWAVTAIADRVPWRALCFQRGLAVHLMLGRRGIPSILHYGVAQQGERGLRAHVWITQGGDYVIGGEEAADFTCLASFPPNVPSDGGR
jgi:hypothetical protein